MSKELDDILNERQNIHVNAEQNFEKIGKIWAIMLNLDTPIPAWKVALMMDSFKTIRCLVNPNHKDNWLDKQGYTEHGMKAWFNEPGR